ncbi:MAG: large repetitive protein, partial [Miltoncostaeaceae bacterium]|nr:large repetitive protein [Miltoncostaeaceae bacterium]
MTTIRDRQGPPRGLLAAMAAIIALVLALSCGRAAAAGTPCQTSGPTSGAYSVTVCIEAPADGAGLTGATPVSGTAVVSPAASAQGVQRMIFSLDGQYLLTDYAADGSGKYGFSLKSGRFVDGAHTLSAQVLLRDGFSSASSSIGLTFANGVAQPPVNTNSFTPTAGSDPAPGAPFVLAASGDGAGGEIGETRVTSLIDSWNPNLFLYLGDVYEKGTATEFDNWYGPAGVAGLYGRFRAVPNPTVGNHEYVGGA